MKFTREELSWILYDCGNSAYSMAITTALLPIYFGMFKADAGMDLGYFNSIASILVALMAPVLGTIADYRDKKKRFFLFFFLTGVLCTAALAVVPFGNWQMLALLYVLTAIGFSGANVFYDAFLVDISPDARMDRVSTAGFAYGYVASIVPFGISLAVVYFIGMDAPLGYQLGFLITALWWALFTIPMLRHVRQRYYVEAVPNPVRQSFTRLRDTFRNIRGYRYVFLFLIAYFLYIDGVDTIIKMVVPYATAVLGGEMNMFQLLGILLIVQIIAFPSSILYGILAGKYGTRTMMIVGILTYVVAVAFAYFMKTISHIFILGAIIGSAQGGIQALSRSYYAKIIPKESSNEFFGFYNIFGKFAAIFGPLIMALITDMTNNARLSILGILPLFILGLLLFLRLPKELGSQ